MADKSNKDNYSDNDYSKRPLWQWVLIYLVFGGIIYALIYYFIFVDQNNSGSNITPDSTSNSSPY